MAKTRRRKKFSIKSIWKLLLIIILSFIILCFIGGISFLFYIVTTTDSFNAENLYTTESSKIYWADGSLIGTVGVEMRDKVSYDELSESLIDAIVATEDSRFFQHNGFNAARFLKATVQQLLGNSSAGGASTITMQVSKNNFTSTEASGIEGIIRKFRDIYIAVFQIEKNYTKEEIMEFYVNYPFLGSNSYGVGQAANKYFGKDVSDLTLSESAMIAGLFQAPSAYDPYIYPEEAEARRGLVLDLMVRHGYITEKEAEIAGSVPVESMLVGTSSTVSPYQVVLDTVITEVREDTGMDPYSVPMEIYTTFVKKKQDAINKFYKTYDFNNPNIGKKIAANLEVGIAMVNNDDGSVVAIGGGRDKSTEFSLNYATQISRQIGSTAKPIFDYGPAIEYLKWSTYHPLLDDKILYKVGGGQLYDWDSRYEGWMTLDKALVESRNAPALESFQAVPNNKIKQFVLSLGMTPEMGLDGSIHEAHSIGAFEGTSPIQLASAYSAFANGGYYTKAYSYRKIKFVESGKIIEKDVTRTKVMSDYTAYMIAWVLQGVTPSHSVTGTQIATKTGTTSYTYEAIQAAGVPEDSVPDGWIATFSPDYTLTFWIGFDELSKTQHISMYNSGLHKTAIQRKLVNSLFEKNSTFTQPASVVRSKVELETYPAQLPSSYTPSSLVETHLFVKGTEPSETSTRFSKLEAPSNLYANVIGNTITASWDAVTLPQAIDEDYLKEFFKTNYRVNYTKYLNKRISYNNSTFGKFGYRVYVKNSNGELEYIGFTQNTSYSFTVPTYESYTDVLVESGYSKFTKNASNSISTPIDIEASCDYELSFNSGEASEITWSLTKGAYTESKLPVSVYCGSSNYTSSSSITKEAGGSIYASTETITFDTPGTYTITYNSSTHGVLDSIVRTIIVTN